MERKFLIISIFITTGAIAFLSGYLLMPEGGLKKQAGLITERFNSKVEVNSSENKTSGTVLLNSRKFITFVNPFSNFKKIVAVANNSDIVEIDTANLTEKVVYTGQTSIAEAVLSPTGDSIIYSFYDTANTKKWVYLNLKSRESVEIEGNLKSAVFSPQGDQAVYLLTNDGGEKLLISKDGKIIKQALKTRLGATLIAWPSKNFVAITSYDKSGYGDLFTLQNSGDLNKILSYQYDLNVRWSPLGEGVVFSAKDEAGVDRLFYRDIKNNSAVVGLEVAINASKCAWASEREVICGLTNQVQLKDEFYSINLTDGTKKLVATPNINLLIKELALNRSGDIIFVLNDIDSKLYALKLK
ncbi:MAG: hypothetical protein A3J46_03445 [Candidatus Yanofskybacteria bacterium RIFCSPHIGHO2_02_FULL_41_11]|uniref:Dipeptidylpeptidase IV N-terminal domain-containing protein n=1 Tax=Candidatus Yanofskybacteria bacterium RIFCSPHIGHO2_02_FULL_41_11 TaxID=1802675 RepID=A0A1F8FCF3_9BACT|nr:MAG: hypothetical protein A3J46_03445 [Candidatus Yanofskybacteria bacterium RIFCSPHIGHO2_02_FULL_41_11]